MRIGQVAEQSEVNVQTVRLYERLGLLTKPPRLSSGYRDYPKDAVISIRFIKQAKELGFTLGDIKSLLDIKKSKTETLDDMRAVAEARLQSIDDKIRKLQQMRKAIKFGLSHCTCPEQFPACVFSRLFNGDRSEKEST